MNTKELLSWAFEIKQLLIDHKEEISKIKIFQTEEKNFGKKYYRINFQVIDEMTLTFDIEGFSKINTDKTEQQNKAILAIENIKSYKSFNAISFSEEIVTAHYDWIITILNSLVISYELELEIIHTSNYDKTWV